MTPESNNSQLYYDCLNKLVPIPLLYCRKVHDLS